MAQATYENQAKNWDGACRVLQLVTVEGQMNWVTYVLQACAPDAMEWWINATGEVHYGYPGPAMWSGGASPAIQVTVSE